MPTERLKSIIESLAASLPPDWWLAQAFMIKALIAVILVGLVCGSVGSLVVSNRMAFFSDALAHCAFAGVTLGVMLSLVGGWIDYQEWIIPGVMVLFGIGMGLAIALVRENTVLSSDTIIAVFFAFAVAFGGMLFASLRRTSYINPESFMFGSILFIDESDLMILMGLLAVLTLVLIPTYNSIVFASFNPSLARSRNVRVRLLNYVFIVLLALIVNLCLKATGVLLINALLVVPAATATNLSHNARAMFWWSIGICLAAGVGGLWISAHVEVPIGRGESIPLTTSGTIVVLCVAAFFVSLAIRMIRDRRVRLATNGNGPSGPFPRPVSPA